jgi:hypothetical protein
VLRFDGFEQPGCQTAGIDTGPTVMPMVGRVNIRSASASAVIKVSRQLTSNCEIFKQFLKNRAIAYMQSVQLATHQYH